MIKILNIEHTFQEVPFSESGSCTIAIGGSCKFNCNGCSWGSPKPEGTLLSIEEIVIVAKKYKKITDFVCVLGEGTTDQVDLINLFDSLSKEGFKVVYYTGADVDEVPKEVLRSIDYIKVGRWTGVPLSDPNTNQKLYQVESGVCVREIVYSDFYK